MTNPAKKKALVAVVHQELSESYNAYSEKDLHTVKEMLLKSLQLINFSPDRFRGLKQVIIKPNIVEVPYQATDGSVITDPRVLEAFIQILKDYGVQRVVVAEGRSVNMRYEDFRPEDVFEKTGLAEVIKRSGGGIIGWDEPDYVEIDNPGAELLPRINVPKSILDSDMFVSIPKMKTHCQTEITVGIKAMQGVYSVTDKIRFHNEAFPWKMIDILRVIPPHLTIADALIAGEGYGPIYSQPVRMDMIVVSEDVVALDAVCSYLMGIDPDEVPMTRLGHSEGIGIGDLSQIEIKGEDIEAVKKYFKRSAMLWNPIGASKNVRIFAGGACRFCLAQVGASLMRLKFEGLLDKFKEDIKVVVGYNLPDTPKKYEHVYVIGDCAKNYLESLGKLEGTVVEGCPPLPSKQIYELFLKHINKGEKE
ncbi:MAG: DUF362 domain-containing protein [Calditrichaeota bacterium]|nr:MAG: DUF362 domain-containing protein [Calditrichota bacterium]